jgi:hypothetical protein
MRSSDNAEGTEMARDVSQSIPDRRPIALLVIRLIIRTAAPQSQPS